MATRRDTRTTATENFMGRKSPQITRGIDRKSKMNR